MPAVSGIGSGQNILVRRDRRRDASKPGMNEHARQPPPVCAYISVQPDLYAIPHIVLVGNNII